MKATPEQHIILEAAKDPKIKMLKVNSVAGSGKTTVLVKISKLIAPKNGLYLAYNKAIAMEAATKFSTGTNCMTTHSLAYQNTVKNYNLSVGFFNYKHIKERIMYEEKILVIDLLNEFCLSRFSKFDDFINYKKRVMINISEKMFALVKKYFLEMAKGKIDITHAGYLKYYHILLANKQIIHKEFDLIMLDEAGDLNEVTLEIFKLLPSEKKIMVGDENQNIYTFNNTINGFDIMRDEGVQLNMTQSFRCSIEIGERIESFCKKYIDKNIEFKGTEQKGFIIDTRAYISRNNSTLVGKMIELNNSKIKYNLTRPANSIFELIMIILNLKPGGQVFSKEWKFLQDDIDEWVDDPLLRKIHNTGRGYIASKYNNDPGVASAINILSKYKPGEIYAAFENAKSHEKEKGHKYTLCTAHSSKGLEFDLVEIGEDLNLTIEKIIIEKKIHEYDAKDIESLRLYYVATSRALKELVRADHLPYPYEL